MQGNSTARSINDGQTSPQRLNIQTTSLTQPRNNLQQARNKADNRQLYGQWRHALHPWEIIFHLSENFLAGKFSSKNIKFRTGNHPFWEICERH